MNNTYDNEMKIEFLSKSNNEAFARITVAAFASQLDPTIEEIADIKTAVSEAVTNAIIHGYEDCDGIVKIVCKLFANTITIEISDTGKGIENIEIAKQPLYTSKPNLESPLIFNIFITCSFTFMTSNFPPKTFTFLYLPNINPIPALSIKET